MRHLFIPHRRRHQDEMLGVLMTGAHAGQRWPGRAESADLIAGALPIRLRPPRDDARRRWADALAVASVVVPVLVLAYLTALSLAAQTARPGGSRVWPRRWSHSAWAPPPGPSWPCSSCCGSGAGRAWPPPAGGPESRPPLT